MKNKFQMVNWEDNDTYHKMSSDIMIIEEKSFFSHEKNVIHFAIVFYTVIYYNI